VEEDEHYQRQAIRFFSVTVWVINQRRFGQNELFHLNELMSL
jgi:hypothetical protein